MTLSVLRTWTAWGVRLATLAWLAFHFALTGLYVLHENPLRTALAPVVNAYVDTYFSQNWDLFAPNPLSHNLSLLVRPLTRAEVVAAETRGVPGTGWYDLTRPLSAQHHNPFSYDQMLAHHQVFTLQSYLYGPPANRNQALKMLWRVATQFVNARTPSSPTYVSMALKIREEMEKPWPPRAGERRAVRYVWVGVYPRDPTLAPLLVPAVEVRP